MSIKLLFLTNILGLILILGLHNIKLIINTNKLLIRQISLSISIITFYICIYIWYIYNSNILGFQSVESILNINWGIDGISLILVVLTAFLGPIALLSNWNININDKTNQKDVMYVSLILILVFLMILNFICLDMISFYVLFESTLAPLFLLIGIYGASNKEKAAYYVLVYTLGSSLFMLLSIGIYTYILNTTDYLSINSIILSIDLQCIIWLGIFIGIAVKTPLLPVHTWLPVVHSESPLGGSILLAGVILKLAIYGVLRLLIPNLTEATILYIPAIYVIAVITIIYTSLITLRQTDLKVIIAYSSISHLGVCILGIFANNLIGIEGSLLLCLAHGFVSPALFIAVGGILYDRYHNRLLYYYQGLSTYMPIFSVYLVFFSFCNIGTPLSVNFLGEFLSFTGAFQNHPLLIAFATISVLLSASYQMKLTNRLTGGSKSPYLKITKDLTNREIFLMNYLLIPTLFLGLYPTPLTNVLNLSCSSVLYHIM